MAANRRWLIAAGVLAALAFGVYVSWRSAHGSTDFDTYYLAARRALTGLSLYSEVPGVSPYVYPPFFACLIAPLAFLPFGIAAFVWYLANLVLVALLAALSLDLSFGLRDTGRRLRELPVVIVILWAAVSCALVADNLAMLQANILISTALVGCLHLLRKGRDIAAGCLLAAAIAIKFFPILILLFLITQRRKRAAASTLAWLVALSLVLPAACMGPGRALGELGHWTRHTLFRTVSMVPNADTRCVMFAESNQSVAALVTRWLTGNDYALVTWKRVYNDYPASLVNATAGLSPDAVRAISLALVLSIVAMTLLRFRAGRFPRSTEGGFCLAMTASLVSNPIVRFEQFLILLFPYTFALSLVPAEGRGGALIRASFIACSAFYIAQALEPCALLGFGALSTLCLWLILYAHDRPRKSAPGSPMTNSRPAIPMARSLSVAIALVSLCCAQADAEEVRAYLSRSRMVIEDGIPYGIAPVLYAEVEVQGKEIVRRTYTVRKNGIFPVGENRFEIVAHSNERPSDTRPAWLRKVLKAFGKESPRVTEDIMRAVNLDEMARGTARSVIMITVGDSFLIEMDTQCPYPTLTNPNIIDYRYYRRTGRLATSAAPPEAPNDF